MRGAIFLWDVDKYKNLKGSSKEEKTPTWTQLDANHAQKHNGTKEDAWTHF